ncbi:UNVERIFIED_CONTAM: hypothetical protein PYX00_001783 [Menopon gallinae]|uniref:LITAF domain-containing protein n=1 Tax=Menopon gallinae TaxID=328185 RepID=A0AAW2IE45_9NEOP
MTDKQRDKYGVQPPYNENLAPDNPPSYNDAVAHQGKSQNFTVLYSVLPIQQAIQCRPITSIGYCTPPVITVPMTVGPGPMGTTCPTCRRPIITKTKTVIQKSAHIACFVLFICGCCFCSCIPYCMKSFKDVQHRCPDCGTFIGVYKH